MACFLTNPTRGLVADLVRLEAPPFNPNADAAAAKMVIKARGDVTFMVAV
jgi:hypothetical protein